ncbi:MAG: hypothetical protein P9L96_05755 [Candidatus Gygaella obscura]|nr:hypothetical protein [Candidatus Gygaella obscura]
MKKLFLFSILVVVLSVNAAWADSFKDKINSIRWIAYSPTNYNPDKGIYPQKDSVAKDLKVLKKYGFEGIVTYGALDILGEIPRMAKEIGFKGVVMGIWDIANRDEIINATLAKNYVDGYCMGNEGLNKRYDLAALKSAIKSLKLSTDKPVTTTEEIFDYANDDVFKLGDWIFPNIHPFLCNVKDPEKAIYWTKGHYNILNKHNTDSRAIIFKETGFPTKGMYAATQDNQKEYFLLLEKAGIPFVYFEAFDQSWKAHLPCEMHWGLFDLKRRPKKFIRDKLFTKK